jgi:hypothetical protein
MLSLEFMRVLCEKIMALCKYCAYQCDGAKAEDQRNRIAV